MTLTSALDPMTGPDPMRSCGTPQTLLVIAVLAALTARLLSRRAGRS